MVMIELTPYQASTIEEQNRLRTILKEHSGEGEKAKVPVIGIVRAGNAQNLVMFGRQFWVQDPMSTIQTLKNQGLIALIQQLNKL